jgi:RNA polymerase sigma-70 factor (ECF subfamily)
MWPLALHRYHAWHATRADLPCRLGRSANAGGAYDAAIELAVNPAQITYLRRRRVGLTARA